MRRLLLSLVATLLLSGCSTGHLTVKLWHGGKVERQVCKGYETEPYEKKSGGVSFSTNNNYFTGSSSSDGTGPWMLTRCTEYVTVDPLTIVGYVGSDNALYKCRVSLEFYEVVAEGQAYEIPTHQCRLVPPDLAEGTVQLP